MVDPKTLKTWIDKGEAILVDVREPAEHAAQSIPGATLLPLGKISRTALPALQNKKLVLHCKAGKRGGVACETLLKESPELEIYNLEGGIDAWAQAGHDTRSSGKFFLPLDRQVQLTIGSAVVLGVVFGYMVHPNFFLVSGFFGLGLMNAGITGWCGLAKLMARMPWNQSTSN